MEKWDTSSSCNEWMRERRSSRRRNGVYPTVEWTGIYFDKKRCLFKTVGKDILVRVVATFLVKGNCCVSCQLLVGSSSSFFALGVTIFSWLFSGKLALKW